MAKRKGSNNGPVASEELRLLMERAERIAEGVKNIQADLKDVFAEAKSRGFDVPTIKTVLKLRKMDKVQRDSTLSMVEVYMMALGMLDGSLSDQASSFLEERTKSTKPDAEPDADAGKAPGAPPQAAPPIADDPQADPDAPPPAPLTVDDAKRLGAEAAKTGKPVTANPFPARDPRRAAWDHAWCTSAGSDGMELPEFLKAPSKKDPKPAADPEGDEDDGGDGDEGDDG